jgi:hypothetical protein
VNLDKLLSPSGCHKEGPMGTTPWHIIGTLRVVVSDFLPSLGPHFLFYTVLHINSILLIQKGAGEWTWSGDDACKSPCQG